MEFNLKEVAITIIIGAYLIIGLEFLVYLFLKRSVSLHLLNLVESKGISSQVLAAIALFSCFAAGMLAEALSDKLVDEDTLLQKYILGIIPKVKTDDQIKQHTLFGDEEIAHPLARESARRNLFRLYGGEHGESVQKSLLCNDGKLQGISLEDRAATSKSLYYHAKNMVYKEGTYFSELQKVQMRIDFARSSAFVSGMLLLFYYLLFGYRFLRLRHLKKRLRKTGKIKKNSAVVSAPSGRVKKFLKLIKRVFYKKIKIRRLRLGFFCGFIIIFIASILAYDAEEFNFDKRVFGYFSSMKANPGGELKKETEDCSGIGEENRIKSMHYGGENESRWRTGFTR